MRTIALIFILALAGCKKEEPKPKPTPPAPAPQTEAYVDMYTYGWGEKYFYRIYWGSDSIKGYTDKHAEYVGIIPSRTIQVQARKSIYASDTTRLYFYLSADPGIFHEIRDTLIDTTLTLW